MTTPFRSGHPRVRRAGAFAATLLAALLTSAAARADQFVVLDSTWEHSADLPDSHYRVDPLPGAPADWVSPVDYASGTAHIHLEVKTKPTETPTKFQVCFEATPTYACTDQSPTYTDVGVLDWATPFSSFWSPPDTAVDWTQGTNKLAVILKDTENGKPSADNVGDETAALYMPTQVWMVVTIVAPGSEYIPPGRPDGGAPDAGGGGSTGATSGAGGEGAGPSAASAGAGAAPPDAGTAAPAASSPGADDGCAVGPGSTSARCPAWLALGAAAIAALCTRGRRATLRRISAARLR